MVDSAIMADMATHHMVVTHHTVSEPQLIPILSYNLI